MLNRIYYNQSSLYNMYCIYNMTIYKVPTIFVIRNFNIIFLWLGINVYYHCLQVYYMILHFDHIWALFKHNIYLNLILNNACGYVLFTGSTWIDTFNEYVIQFKNNHHGRFSCDRLLLHNYYETYIHIYGIIDIETILE